MQHRVFIAINLPEKVKSKLADFQVKWPDLPCRWTSRENLHITLMFLGYLSDEEMMKVCEETRQAVSKHEPFSLTLKKIVYGPPKKSPPRMVWVEGEKSIELGKLQKDLEDALLSSPTGQIQKESRPYSPHITLGRIRMWDFRRLEPETRPEIAEEIDLTFEVDSIEVMESQLKRGGPFYTVVESMFLK
jgi:2'-5' RNA ligase